MRWADERLVADLESEGAVPREVQDAADTESGGAEDHERIARREQRIARCAKCATFDQVQHRRRRARDPAYSSACGHVTKDSISNP